MSGPVRAILEEQRTKRAEGQEFVFTRNGHAFSGWTHARTELDKRILEMTGHPLPHWTPHDLRRTAATRMAEDLQIQPHVVEAILNHVSGHKSGIVAVYNLATYANEKAQALDLWADHVTAIVAGRSSNVTTLRRA
jgi:integrase